MTAHLSDATAERIEDERTPRRISENLAVRLGYADDQALQMGRTAHHATYGGEADGLASRVLGWLGRKTWAEVVDAADYEPSAITDAALARVHDRAIDRADECGRHPANLLGNALACIGERFARHSAEHALEGHFDDTSLAGIEREHENVDVTCAAGDAQVYTGSSAKYWYNKSNAPECSKKVSEMDHETAVEQTNFDVFVFIRIIDGAFYVGAKEIANENETAANTQAKP